MPNRYIEIPDPVRLVDPKTKEVVEGDDGVFDFERLLHKVSDNPKWNSSYKLGRTMDAIWEAWENRDESYGLNGLMILAEEDWKEFDDAVQNPRQLLLTPNGPTTITGFGLHPRLVRQTLSISASVVDALPKDPRGQKKPVEEVKAG